MTDVTMTDETMTDETMAILGREGEIPEHPCDGPFPTDLRT